MTERFARPFFCSPHAVDRYRSRVDRLASARQAILAIQTALQSPVWEEPGATAHFYGCRRPDGRSFVAVVGPPPTGKAWPVVVTVGEPWRWHEFRRLWRGDRRARAVGLRRYTPEESEFVIARLPYWTLGAIAAHLGRTTESVQKWCWRNHQSATRQHLVTSGQAAELTGWSQQWITSLCRRGQIRAHKKPGGRWWLIDPDQLPRCPEWHSLRPWRARSYRPPTERTVVTRSSASLVG